MSGYNTKAEAEAVGEKIRAKLGPQWEVITWENFGWHVKVSLHNMIHIYEGMYDLYVMIGKGGSMNAALSPTFEEMHGKNPVKLVKKAVTAYKRNLDAFIEEQKGILEAGLKYIEQTA